MPRYSLKSQFYVLTYNYNDYLFVLAETHERCLQLQITTNADDTCHLRISSTILQYFSLYV